MRVQTDMVFQLSLSWFITRRTVGRSAFAAKKEISAVLRSKEGWVLTNTAEVAEGISHTANHWQAREDRSRARSATENAASAPVRKCSRQLAGLPGGVAFEPLHTASYCGVTGHSTALPPRKRHFRRERQALHSLGAHGQTCFPPSRCEHCLSWPRDNDAVRPSQSTFRR